MDKISGTYAVDKIPINRMNMGVGMHYVDMRRPLPEWYLEHCGCKVQSPRPDAADGAMVKGFKDSKDNMKLW